MEEVQSNAILEQWQASFDQRVDLWKSLIKESALEEAVKSKFMKLMERQEIFRFGKEVEYGGTIGDWVRETISVLDRAGISAKRSSTDPKEIEALLDNLKKDIQTFYKELK